MTDHTRYAHWDAAYLLRALSTDDRRRYEEHVEGCRQCREAIAELAPTIGLLARVTPERAQAVLEPVADDVAGPDPVARERVVARGRRDARRRRVLAWGGGVAAAAALAVVVAFAVSSAVAPTPVPEEIVALQPTTEVPLTATVQLTDVAWGTRIEMTCRYGGSGDPYALDQDWSYVLVVTSTDGETSELSSWRAAPGTTATLDAGTALDPGEIASIEVRAAADGRVLLRGEPAPPGQ